MTTSSSEKPLDSTTDLAPNNANNFYFWLKVYGAFFLIIQLVIVTLFIGLPFFGYGGEKSQQKALLSKAEDLRENQQYADALAVLVDFGEKWPGAYETQNFNRRIGEYYLDAGEPAKAVEHLRKSIEIDPNIPGGWAQWGIALWNQDKKQQAYTQFAQELEKGNLDSDIANYYLGQYHFELKNYKQAFDHFAAVKETYPDYNKLDAYRREFIQITLNSEASPQDSTKVNP
ncbi:MAG: tetratricopeptide repeat protein [Sumerlaeia bacterium]